jgi:diguanylate cyclase (GGDEF)-like protein
MRVISLAFERHDCDATQGDAGMPGRLTSMGQVLLETAPPGRPRLRALAISILLAVLYLVPIFISTWNVGLRAGSGIALLSAISLTLGSVLGGLPYGTWLVPASMLVLTAALLVAFAVLLAVLRRALDREKEFARTDPLTGVSNRRHFVDLAAADLALARRYQRPLTVAYIDLDNFKEVNDRLGHRAGDELLNTVARTIRRRLRVTDAVGRLGGDEFAICLPETGADAATKVLGKLREDVAAALPETCRFVTLSVGMVTFAYPPATVEELIERTDFVLYAAKREGKNRLIHEVVPA